MADVSQSSTRNPGIDLLRGIAILLVLLVHLRIRMPLKDGLIGAITPQWLLTMLLDRGHEAVYIFFVISGFLITTHTLWRWGDLRSIDALAFWRRRSARILPCLILLVVVLSVLHVLNVQGYTIWRPGQSLTGAIVAALGFHINWYEGRTGYLPGSWDVLWSLAIEEIFYLAFPIACVLIRNRIAMMVLLAVFALSLPILKAQTGGSEIWQQKAYLPGMSAIAMGVLSALIAARLRNPSQPLVRTLCVLGTLGLFFALALSDVWLALRYTMQLVLTLSAACLIVAFHWRSTQGAWAAIPGTAWLRSMGQLSYEIYLSHMFVVLLVARLFALTEWSPYWAFIWYAPAIMGAWLLGRLVERYVSIPSMRLLLGREMHTRTPLAQHAPRQT